MLKPYIYSQVFHNDQPFVFSLQKKLRLLLPSLNSTQKRNGYSSYPFEEFLSFHLSLRKRVSFIHRLEISLSKVSFDIFKPKLSEGSSSFAINCYQNEWHPSSSAYPAYLQTISAQRLGPISNSISQWGAHLKLPLPQMVGSINRLGYAVLEGHSQRRFVTRADSQPWDMRLRYYINSVSEQYLTCGSSAP